MKNYLLIALLFVCSFAGFAQKNAVKFNKMVHDYGTIKEEDGEHPYVFKFKNNGEQPITIQNVIASCGCTTPTWTQHEIGKKDSGFVKAIFNAANRPGPFEKKLTVYLTSALGNDSLILTIKGNVKPKFKNPILDFPDKIGGLRVQSRYINLDKINDKEPVSKEYGIYNDTTMDLNLKVLNPQSKYMKITVEPAVLKPQQKGVIKLVYDGKARNDYGYVSDYFEIETNELAQNKKLLYVSATIEEFFAPMTEAQLALAPKIAIDKKEIDFGTVKEGEVAKAAFVITNTGKSDLKIRKTVASCGCTASVPEKTTIAAGESTNINISFNSNGRAGTQSKTITVFSNDPTAPVQYMSIKAFVVK